MALAICSKLTPEPTTWLLYYGASSLLWIYPWENQGDTWTLENGLKTQILLYLILRDYIVRFSKHKKLSFNFKISLKTLKTILVSIYLFCSFKSIGRDSTLVNTIILKGLDKTSIDAFNNIYISDSAGQIYKFDPKGQLITQNQTFKTRALNLLEANNTVRIYCFYKDLQCFLLRTDNWVFRFNISG